MQLIYFRQINQNIVMRYDHKYGKELEGLIIKAAKSPKLLHEFLYDLLTHTEYKDLAVRWQIVKLLEQGLPHHQIAKKLKVSVATVTRGSKEMFNNYGGFKMILNKHYKALKIKPNKKPFSK